VYRLPRQGSAARISPDGRWLAFDEYGGAAQTYSFSTLPAAGGAPQPVCTLGQLPRHFEVSADSRWLVIQTMNLSKQVGDIWVAPLSGGEPRPLTMRGNMNSFSLHPDGTRIAFGNRTKPDEEVWLLENFLPPVKGPKDH
jgi:Tol biopolymer transport system component